MIATANMNFKAPKKRSMGTPIIGKEWENCHFMVREKERLRAIEKEKGYDRSPMDIFLKRAMMKITAREYALGFNDYEINHQQWHDLCTHVGVEVQEYQLPKSSASIRKHFDAHAAMVIEECRYVLSAALATRWIDPTSKGNNFLSQPKLSHPSSLLSNDKLACPPMTMILTRREFITKFVHTKLDFQLEVGQSFDPRQSFFLRAGTVVECLPLGAHNGIDSVILAVIVETNKSLTVSSGKFSVLTNEMYFHMHAGVARWSVQPLTSFVSEMRQLETCLMLRRGDANTPFLHLLIGDRSCIEEMRKDHAKRKQPPSPTSVVDGTTTPRTLLSHENFVELNQSQVNAAIDFVASKPGSITCVQGPPGSGKTTLLVSTIREYMHRKLAAKTSSTCHKALLVTAPTNKAVSVLASRLFSSIHKHVYPHNYKIKMVMLGDDEKLTDDEYLPHIRHEDHNLGSDVDTRSPFSSNKHILAYQRLPSAVFAFEHLQKAMQRHPHDYKLSLLPEHANYCNFFELFIQVGHIFKPEVKARAQKFLKGLRQSRNSSRWIHERAELLQQVINDARELSKNSKIRYRVACWLVQSADIIFCTLATAGCNIFKSKEAPVRVGDLIVDEASCATESEVAIPFHLHPRRALIVGDPNQLPATVNSPRARSFGHGKSLHERLMKDLKTPYTMLNQQYRMRPEIADFPSRQFYRGKLKNASIVTKPRYRSPLPLLEDSQGPFLFQQVDGMEEQTSTGSWQNVEEADEVVEWILKLKAKASQNIQHRWYISDRVRIITFYQAQVNLINSKLALHGFGTRDSGLLATTVDSSQGCESDLVIVSFVRTCHRTWGGARHIAGFLTDDRRINVALTRARYELICIGNAHNMVANSEIGTLQALACHALSSGNVSGAIEDVAGKNVEDEATAKKRKKKEKRANETEEEKRLRKQKKKEKKEKKSLEEAKLREQMEKEEKKKRKKEMKAAKKERKRLKLSVTSD